MVQQPLNIISICPIGFDVNGQDGRDKNKTPLQLACQYGREALVPELLELGASLDLKNSDDLTAMDLAKNEDIVKILFKSTRYAKHFIYSFRNDKKSWKKCR